MNEWQTKHGVYLYFRVLHADMSELVPEKKPGLPPSTQYLIETKKHMTDLRQNLSEQMIHLNGARKQEIEVNLPHLTVVLAVVSAVVSADYKTSASKLVYLNNAYLPKVYRALLQVSVS